MGRDIRAQGSVCCVYCCSRCPWLTPLPPAKPGPYRHGIFKFTISFPERYPDVAPTIVFHTSIYHPLIAPLIPSSSAPGLFSLRHGFPHWFSSESEKKVLPTPGAATPAERRETTALEVLQYVKASLDDAAVLDGIPLGAAEHPAAWKAWTAGESGRCTTGGWDERVRVAVEGSTSEGAVYGGVAGRGGDESVGCVFLVGTGRGLLIWGRFGLWTWMRIRWARLKSKLRWRWTRGRPVADALWLGGFLGLVTYIHIDVFEFRAVFFEGQTLLFSAPALCFISYTVDTRGFFASSLFITPATAVPSSSLGLSPCHDSQRSRPFSSYSLRTTPTTAQN